MNPTCPRCEGKNCSRVKRQGFLQSYILPRFNLFPWECGDCRHVFSARKRGKLKRRSSSSSSANAGNV